MRRAVIERSIAASAEPAAPQPAAA